MQRVQSGYYAFFPRPLPPELNWSAPLVQALSRADRALGELSGLSNAIPNPYLLVRPFIRREAVLSSRIEGTKASLMDVYTYEAVQLSLIFSLTRPIHPSHRPPHEMGNDVAERFSRRLFQIGHDKLVADRLVKGREPFGQRPGLA